MTNEQYGLMMYGPKRWAAVKRANGQQLGWSISSIGNGLLNIGTKVLDWWSDSRSTSVYKDAAATALMQQQQLTNTIFKAAAIIGIGLVAASVIKGK